MSITLNQKIYLGALKEYEPITPEKILFFEYLKVKEIRGARIY